MMSLTFGLFTQVSISGPQGPLVLTSKALHLGADFCSSIVKLFCNPLLQTYFLSSLWIPGQQNCSKKVSS